MVYIQTGVLLLLVGVVLVAEYTVPGDGVATQWRFGSAVQTAVAFGDARVGTLVFTTNVVLSGVTAVQALLVALAAGLFLRHWAVVSLISPQGISFATLDVILQNNYLQLALHFWRTPNLQILAIGLISLFSLLFVRAADLLVQNFVVNGYGYYPGVSQVFYPNTTVVSSDLITDSGDWTPIASGRLFEYFSASMLTVARDCGDGICGTKTNASLSLLSCSGLAENCTSVIPVYSDYYMSCTRDLSSVSSSSTPLMAQVSVLIDPHTTFVNNSVPSVIWDVTFVPPGSNTTAKNNVTALHVACTIYAAWTNRLENSLLGTWETEYVEVYNTTQEATNPSTRDEYSFNNQKNCGNLPAVFCQLFFLGSVMNSPWSGTSTVVGLEPWGLSMLSIPTFANSQNTSAQEMLANLETYMRFFVETATKTIILDELKPSVNDTCLDCAFRDARCSQKVNVMLFVGFISGIGMLMMLLSIAMTYKTGISLQYINCIDIAQMPVVSDSVRSHVIDSLKPKSEVQYTEKIGYPRVESGENFDKNAAIDSAGGWVGSLQRRSQVNSSIRLSWIGEGKRIPSQLRSNNRESILSTQYQPMGGN
ncbi:hypothetical protein HK100_002620 [Physocladia obscura]|uniref:Membrane-associated protein n=1 Tax=Physocladia obscura TaxID=109957 RepID=A0AAD5SXV2_9FUNG|nr:hypothetical protein HK100_002620 [Physocladia obscura]